MPNSDSTEKSPIDTPCVCDGDPVCAICNGTGVVPRERIVEPAETGRVGEAEWMVDAPDAAGYVVLTVLHPRALAPVMLAFNRDHIDTLRATIEALMSTQAQLGFGKHAVTPIAPPLGPTHACNAALPFGDAKTLTVIQGPGWAKCAACHEPLTGNLFDHACKLIGGADGK